MLLTQRSPSVSNLARVIVSYVSDLEQGEITEELISVGGPVRRVLPVLLAEFPARSLSGLVDIYFGPSLILEVTNCYHFIKIA